MVDKKDPWNSGSMNPTNLFGFSIVAGILTILVGTYYSNVVINIVFPVGIMLYYAYTINKDTSESLSIEQKADSVYYMGFILTLVAMTASLVALDTNEEFRFNVIVINFGLALATTILGLTIRIIWLQLSSQDLADAESILKERILKRSQDLQDQTEKVIGSLTALSNQLSKVSEPLKNNFDRLTQTMEINEGAINKLRHLDQSADSAAQSLRLIANLAERMAVSTSELKRTVDNDTLDKIDSLKLSAGEARPKIEELDSEISTSINTIRESLDSLQDSIRRTDEMIAHSQASQEKNDSILKKFITSIKNLLRRD